MPDNYDSMEMDEENYDGPDAAEICELAQELESEFQEQKDEDEATRDVLLRRNLLSVQKPEEGHKIKRLASGYPALIAEQDFSFLTAPPFLRVNPMTPAQEPHADKLETGLVGMWSLSQGHTDVWLDQVYDYVWSGRGWSMVCPVPELWSGDMMRMDGEETKSYLDRVSKMKEDCFPVIWKSVPVENTWPTFDIRGDLDRVIGIRQMKVRDVRRYYGDHLCVEKSGKSEVRVIEYADSQWMCTVLDTDNPVICHAWNHGMGMNPYVLAEAPRSAPKTEGMRWQGALFHTRELLTELDSIISDIRYNVGRATRGQLLAKLDLEARGASPEAGGSSDIIDIKPHEAIVIDKTEDVGELQPARTNIDAYQLVAIIQGLTKEVAVRSVLLGILGQGGAESGIMYNTAAQFAQKQYGPAVSQLQKAAVAVGRRLFKSVEVFAEEDEEVPILFTTAFGKTERLGLKKKDVEGWGRTIQARIDLAIPVNEAANITNAKLVTDPSNPLMSYETAAPRYLQIENPLEEYKKIARSTIRRSLLPLLSQVVSESGLHLMNEPDKNDAELSSMFAGLPLPVQQAIAAHAAQTGQQVPGSMPENNAVQGQINRSAANHNKANRFQNTQAVSQAGAQSRGY